MPVAEAYRKQVPNHTRCLPEIASASDGKKCEW